MTKTDKLKYKVGDIVEFIVGKTKYKGKIIGIWSEREKIYRIDFLYYAIDTLLNENSITSIVEV